MTPWRHYADGPFGQVHFQVLGEGAPLVLLHQAPITSGQFDNVYAPLAIRGFRVIGIDMPGFGMSDPTPGVPTIGTARRMCRRCSTRSGWRRQRCSVTSPVR